jgi:hypothetical protein
VDVPRLLDLAVPVRTSIARVPDLAISESCKLARAVSLWSSMPKFLLSWMRQWRKPASVSSPTLIAARPHSVSSRSSAKTVQFSRTRPERGCALKVQPMNCGLAWS